MSETTTAEPEEGQEPEQNPSREAARYRRRLRETEAERDQLAEVVTTMRRAEVERLAGEHLADPGDFWALGGVTDLAELLDEESGAVDAGKVEQAVESLLQQKPRLARDYAPEADAFDGGARRTPQHSSASWQTLLSPGTSR